MFYLVLLNQSSHIKLITLFIIFLNYITIFYLKKRTGYPLFFFLFFFAVGLLHNHVGPTNKINISTSSYMEK
jgi:hypothetical protein